MSQAIRDHLEDANRAIGAVNATIAEPGHLTVNDTCNITDRLTDLAWSLDRTCSCLARNLDQRIEANDMCHDSGGDPTETTISAAAKLRSASHQIAFTAQLLDDASHQLARIADFAPLANDPDFGVEIGGEGR